MAEPIWIFWPATTKAPRVSARRWGEPPRGSMKATATPPAMNPNLAQLTCDVG
jgi:hypothetical protein